MWFGGSRGVSAIDETQPTSGDPEVSDFDVTYSEENILKWMAYLPPDCVQCMIRMGWDIST